MLFNYLKIAFRTLRRQGSYTFLNVLGLAVGMAGGLLLFLFVQHHWRTDRHHSRFDRIYRVVLDMHLEDGSIEYYPEAPLPMSEVLRRDFPQVEQAGFLRMHRDLTISFNQPGTTSPTRFLEHEGAGFVEPAWFGILDYHWLVGSPEVSLSQPNSVVLTQSWARRYFGTANPVGRMLTINGTIQAKVTGLLADPSPYTDTNVGLFVSLPTLKRLYPTLDLTDWFWTDSPNRVYVVLRDEQAARSLEAALPALSMKYYGDTASVFHYHLQPLRDVHFDVRRMGGVIRWSLLWSLAVVGVLLVGVACVNFINLATAQALRRGKEVGIRKTLGSSRGQLAGQFLFETALIVVGALALAWLLVAASLPVFNDWIGLRLSVRPDAQLLAFLAGMASLVILLAGGYPALVLSGFSPWAALRGTLSRQAIGGYSLRQVLVVGQFVVCQVLMLGAIVVAAQLRYVQQADLGYQKANVMLVPLPAPTASTRETLRNRLLQVPGVESVSFSLYPPSSDKMNGGQFQLDGSSKWQEFIVRERLADAEYLRTYGLKLVAGRNLAASDTIREFLVNEAFARKLGIRDPSRLVGRKMRAGSASGHYPIVGVVKDFHLKSLHEPIVPGYIASDANAFRRAGIRLTGKHPLETQRQIQDIWQELYPGDVFEYTFLSEQLTRFYATETLISRLVLVFTGLVILISCLGLYGLVSLAVVQRTKEIGVRKVLGASVVSIVALFSTDFLKLVLMAIFLASPLAWYLLDDWLQNFAYRIAMPWWAFVLAGVLAVGIALLTVSFQSIKAALMDPVKSIRAE